MAPAAWTPCRRRCKTAAGLPRMPRETAPEGGLWLRALREVDLSVASSRWKCTGDGL